MAGQIRRMLDQILQQRSKGDPTIYNATKVKLIFKGLNPDKFDARSADDPGVLAHVREAAAELGIKL